MNMWFNAKALIEARKKLGMRQADLADMIEKTRGYIGHLETARKLPGAETLIKLSLAFQVPIESFLNLDCLSVRQGSPTPD